MRKVVIRSENPTSNLKAKEKVIVCVQDAQAQLAHPVHAANDVDIYGPPPSMEVNSTVLGSDVIPT